MLSERNKEIIALYEAGETGTKIGSRFGISRERVYQILQANGVLIRCGGKGPPLDEEKVAAAIFLVMDGTFLPCVAAREVGLNPWSFYQFCRRRGIVEPSRVDTKWRDEEISYVRCWYRRGKSATQIARDLGRNRNEVIGKANRLGLVGVPLREAAE